MDVLDETNPLTATVKIKIERLAEATIVYLASYFDVFLEDDFLAPPPPRTKKKSIPNLLPIARQLRLLDIAHELHMEQRTATMREVYYRHRDLFPTMPSVRGQIAAICRRANLHSRDLRILAQAKGFVTGPVRFSGIGVALSAAVCAVSISDALTDPCRTTLSLENTDIMGFLVVEKESIFYAVSSSFTDKELPFVLITGCGYPDLATRILVQRLVAAFPQYPVGFLGDFDPHGVAICCDYRFGSRAGLFSSSLPSIHWIGVQTEDFLSIPTASTLPLGPKDMQLIIKLQSRLRVEFGTGGINNLNRSLLGALDTMTSRGRKAEAEALFGLSRTFLTELVIQRMCRLMEQRQALISRDLDGEVEDASPDTSAPPSHFVPREAEQSSGFLNSSNF